MLGKRRSEVDDVDGVEPELTEQLKATVERRKQSRRFLRAHHVFRQWVERDPDRWQPQLGRPCERPINDALMTAVHAVEDADCRDRATQIGRRLRQLASPAETPAR